MFIEFIIIELKIPIQSVHSATKTDIFQTHPITGTLPSTYQKYLQCSKVKVDISAVFEEKC